MASISPIHASDGSPRYVVNYRDPEDRQRRKSFRKKADAEAFRNTVEADKLRGTYLDVDAGRVTFRDYAAEWLANRTFDRTTYEATDLRLRVHVLPSHRSPAAAADQAVDHPRIDADDGPVGHLPPRHPGQRLGNLRRRGRRRPDREEPVQGWIRHATVRSSPQSRAVASRAGQCHARRPPRALPAGCHAGFRPGPPAGRDLRPLPHRLQLPRWHGRGPATGANPRRQQTRLRSAEGSQDADRPTAFERRGRGQRSHGRVPAGAREPPVADAGEAPSVWPFRFC